jgi:hypothetical protein
LFLLKDEGSKKLNILSKKIKEIYEILEKDDNHGNGGMLTKKHIGPVNCASCDKNISNLSGLKVEFNS